MQILIVLLVLAALIMLAGAWYQHSGAIRDVLRFPAPGRLIDIGEVRLHLDAAGEGSPLVVFEAGIAATSISWRLVQPAIAKLTATVSYDRAGLGWSDRTRAPRGIWRVVEELHTLLDCAGYRDVPRILVSHSYGALVAIAYANRYPAEVAGMVLVDPVSAREWTELSEVRRKTLRRGIRLSRRGALLARLGLVRFALTLLVSGAKLVPKLVARTTSGPATGLIDRMVGQILKLPREVWPLIQSHWCDPKCFEGMAGYLEALPESAAAVDKIIADGALRDIPWVVLSCDRANPAERADHERLARLSSRGRMEIAERSGHWIELDRPDLVIRTIGEMVAQCRS